MNESYKNLFIEMCQSAAILAERIMDYDKQKNDEKGYEVAEKMRNDYQELHDVLKEGKAPSYNDYAKLLAAAYIVTNNLQTEVELYQKAIKGYKSDTIPKLSRIVDEGKDNPEVFDKLINELFQSNV